MYSHQSTFMWFQWAMGTGYNASNKTDSLFHMAWLHTWQWAHQTPSSIEFTKTRPLSFDVHQISYQHLWKWCSINIEYTRSSNFNAQDDHAQLVAICANFFVFILTFFQPSSVCTKHTHTHTHIHNVQRSTCLKWCEVVNNFLHELCPGTD